MTKQDAKFLIGLLVLFIILGLAGTSDLTSIL